MSAVDGGPDRPTGSDDALDDRPIGSYFGRMNLRALMDVVFGGAALILLLTWLGISIAGGHLN